MFTKIKIHAQIAEKYKVKYKVFMFTDAFFIDKVFHHLGMHGLIPLIIPCLSLE